MVEMNEKQVKKLFEKAELGKKLTSKDKELGMEAFRQIEHAKGFLKDIGVLDNCYKLEPCREVMPCMIDFGINISIGDNHYIIRSDLEYNGDNVHFSEDENYRMLRCLEFDGMDERTFIKENIENQVFNRFDDGDIYRTLFSEDMDATKVEILEIANDFIDEKGIKEFLKEYGEVRIDNEDIQDLVSGIEDIDEVKESIEAAVNSVDDGQDLVSLEADFNNGYTELGGKMYDLINNAVAGYFTYYNNNNYLIDLGDLAGNDIFKLNSYSGKAEPMTLEDYLKNHSEFSSFVINEKYPSWTKIVPQLVNYCLAGNSPEKLEKVLKILNKEQLSGLEVSTKDAGMKEILAKYGVAEKTANERSR